MVCCAHKLPKLSTQSNQHSNRIAAMIRQDKHEQLSNAAVVEALSSLKVPRYRRLGSTADEEQEYERKTSKRKNGMSFPMGGIAVPGKYDVLCARGKEAYNHPGNVHFRTVVEQHRERYSTIESKWQRTMLVSDIIKYIESRGNGFIKKDKTTGQWVKAGTLIAREKTGQLFRNTLSNQYKSAFKVKRRRRLSAANRLTEKLHKVVISNKRVVEKMEGLREVALQVELVPESKLMTLFTQKNLEILEAIKEDKTMLLKYQEALLNSSIVGNDSSDDDSAASVDDRKSAEV